MAANERYAVRCEKCNKRISKNLPKLKCSNCECIIHFKCNGLTKRKLSKLLKFTLFGPVKTVFLAFYPLISLSEKCQVCCKKINSKTAIGNCTLCDGRCHRLNCMIGNLRCRTCCNETIPGFEQNSSHDYFGASYLNHKPIFNPYDRNHLINQLGMRSTADLECSSLEDVSNTLTQCEYSTLKQLPSSCNGSPRIMSLNIRSLTKGIDDLKECAPILYQKCDILCLCETNVKLEEPPNSEKNVKPKKLPNGINDVIIDGFHEPIVKDPYRKSGKGGGLAVYVNKNFCESSAIHILLKDIVDKNSTENETSPSGEFLFVKIILKSSENCKNPKNIIIGNIYRSPSSNYPKFIDILHEHLLKL